MSYEIPEIIKDNPQKFFWFTIKWLEEKGIKPLNVCMNDVINAEKDYLQCHK